MILFKCFIVALRSPFLLPLPPDIFNIAGNPVTYHQHNCLIEMQATHMCDIFNLFRGVREQKKKDQLPLLVLLFLLFVFFFVLLQNIENQCRYNCGSMTQFPSTCIYETMCKSMERTPYNCVPPICRHGRTPVVVLIVLSLALLIYWNFFLLF